MKKIKKYLRNPFWIILFLGRRNFFNWVPDKLYLKIIFRIVMGYWFDLKNPKTFNEKLQWLKIYDRQPLYSKLVDKYDVRQYVAEKIGEKHLIPLLGVWNSFDEINFDKLPNQFVLKCTHDSGSVIICTDKKLFDYSLAKKKLVKHLKKNLYWALREWPYKNLKPRIIAEKYMSDGENYVPEDFKVYCVNGEPKYIVVFHNRFNSSKILMETVYDASLNIQNCSFDEHFVATSEPFPYPEKIKEMFSLAKILCENFAQIRTDFYIIHNQIYFGELTLSTASGLTHFVPNEWDKRMGDMIMLPK